MARADYSIVIDRGRLSAALIGRDGALTDWLENSWARQVAARAVMKAPVDSGNLKRSIHPERAKEIGPFRASVSVVADAEYAVFVHEGIASPRNRIVPTKAKALRFVIDGRVIFAKYTRVSDKMRSRPFLRQAMQEVTAQQL